MGLEARIQPLQPFSQVQVEGIVSGGAVQQQARTAVAEGDRDRVNPVTHPIQET